MTVTRRWRITAELIQRYSRRGNFHSDPDLARDAGMHGLVAQGTQVCAPAIGVLLDEWGEALLARGELDLRFVGMVLDDHDVEAVVDIDGAADGDTATFTVTNLTTGLVAAIGTATLRDP